MHGWRSIRAYRLEPLDGAVIEDLLWHAVQVSTPSFSGDAPWAFAVLEGVERIEAFGERAMAYVRDHRPPGAEGWAWTERRDFRVFWGAPAVVLICARSGNSQTPFDCCGAGQNLMLAAHARGLGSCWVGAPLPWLQSPGVAGNWPCRTAMCRSSPCCSAIPSIGRSRSPARDRPSPGAPIHDPRARPSPLHPLPEPLHLARGVPAFGTVVATGVLELAEAARAAGR